MVLASFKNIFFYAGTPPGMLFFLFISLISHMVQVCKYAGYIYWISPFHSLTSFPLKATLTDKSPTLQIDWLIEGLSPSYTTSLHPLPFIEGRTLKNVRHSNYKLCVRTGLKIYTYKPNAQSIMLSLKTLIAVWLPSTRLFWSFEIWTFTILEVFRSLWTRTFYFTDFLAFDITKVKKM